MNPAIVISPEDNVATALEALEVGQTIQAGGATVQVAETIPRGHKVALLAIRAGAVIVKYGSPIGHASSDIAAGSRHRLGWFSNELVGGASAGRAADSQFHAASWPQRSLSLWQRQEI